MGRPPSASADCIQVDDVAFVRAPADLVFRRLIDVAQWPTWWPGVSVCPMADGATAVWALQMAGRWRGLRMSIEAHRVRPDAGLYLTMTGDVAGEAEWWLEPTAGGTCVHHLLSGRGAGPPGWAQRCYRHHLRRGMWACKDRVQAEVRTAMGLPS